MYIMFSAVYFEQGRFEECIEECQKAVDVGRDHSAGYQMIAK